MATVPQSPNSEQKQSANLFTTVRTRAMRLVRIMEDSPDVYAKILMFIERGAYDYIAAEAFGITQITWNKWLERGRKATEGPYRKFFLDVTQAYARARVVAEMSVAQEDPKFYLLNGPGKTRPGRPGWSRDPNTVDSDLSQQNPQGRFAVAQYEEASNSDLARTLEVLAELNFITVDEHLAIADSEENVVEGLVVLPDES